MVELWNKGLIWDTMIGTALIPLDTIQQSDEVTHIKTSVCNDVTQCPSSWWAGVVFQGERTSLRASEKSNFTWRALKQEKYSAKTKLVVDIG